jgi:hypothetical protein
MSGAPGYQSIYGVVLLDDLHNYFPELLYNHGRFQNLTQVFHYVRGQMNRRFNLFAYGAQQHADSMAAAGSSMPFNPRPTPIVTPPIVTEIPVTPMSHIPRVVSVREATENLQAANMLLSLFGGIGGLGAEDPGPQPTRRAASDAWAAFRQPVIVRPTGEAIRRGSEELEGSRVPPGTVCTICQDTIGQIDTCRKLRHCQHTFHRICIDQWFERSVFCPTCRHDIREQQPESGGSA